jgi:hypothetical protein
VQLASISTMHFEAGLRHGRLLPSIAGGYADTATRASIGSWGVPGGLKATRDRARPADDSDDDCTDDAVSHPPAKRAAFGPAALGATGTESKQSFASFKPLPTVTQPSAEPATGASVTPEIEPPSAAVLGNPSKSKELSPGGSPEDAEVSPNEHHVDQRSHLLPGYVPWPLPTEHEE